MTTARLTSQALSTGAERKAGGVHYTPSALASYLASELVKQYLAVHREPSNPTILDPACGDGELLLSLAGCLPTRLLQHVRVLGFDTSEEAASETRRRLAGSGFRSVDVYCRDFLSAVSEDRGSAQLGLSMNESLESGPVFQDVDLVISNPPYVRTQVLGSLQAKALARRFNLSGRVDLYHAFVIAMTKVLRIGGFLGLLTSNRFLSTQAGASLRNWFTREFRLSSLVDLGDTKLFEAAVLPAIIIAEKKAPRGNDTHCRFTRIYESSLCEPPAPPYESILDALRQGRSGAASVGGQRFDIEVGILRTDPDASIPWILTSDSTEGWIRTIADHQAGVFGDFGKVSVGIKTTADKVFIRDDWNALPSDQVPEEELLHNLITHHVAKRWSVDPTDEPTRKVLYPYTDDHGKRQLIDLHDYPRAARYLRSFREILERRQYLADAGRKWYEIWVPQNPSDWLKPKIVSPDINSRNIFFLANPGWIVNGDCYWVTLRPTTPEFTLEAMLAIANSSFIIRFYDVMFHNRLYAGRRRFMSQYIERFPVPKAKSVRTISESVSGLLRAQAEGNHAHVLELEEEVDSLVWESFGLVKEVGG
jgi:adenine-specific DNA-methyltransferase